MFLDLERVAFLFALKVFPSLRNNVLWLQINKCVTVTGSQEAKHIETEATQP